VGSNVHGCRRSKDAKGEWPLRFASDPLASTVVNPTSVRTRITGEVTTLPVPCRCHESLLVVAKPRSHHPPPLFLLVPCRCHESLLVVAKPRSHHFKLLKKTVRRVPSVRSLNAPGNIPFSNTLGTKKAWLCSKCGLCGKTALTNHVA